MRLFCIMYNLFYRMHPHLQDCLRCSSGRDQVFFCTSFSRFGYGKYESNSANRLFTSAYAVVRMRIRIGGERLSFEKDAALVVLPSHS